MSSSRVASCETLSDGDANYRRLLGDRVWALDTPFAEVAAYFPAPLLALRTLKAELGCGISQAASARAAAEDPEVGRVRARGALRSELQMLETRSMPHIDLWPCDEDPNREDA